MYVALLRGINIGSKNKIDMAELKHLFESIDMTQVRTLLNSGNVVFDSSIKDVKVLEGKLETAIKRVFDLEIEIIIRNDLQMKAIIKSYPFAELEEKNRYVTLFKTALASEEQKSLSQSIEATKLDEDQYEVHKSQVALYVPFGYGRTKLTNGFMEKKSGVIGTTRNWNTMIKLEGWMN